MKEGQCSGTTVSGPKADYRDGQMRERLCYEVLRGVDVEGHQLPVQMQISGRARHKYDVLMESHVVGHQKTVPRMILGKGRAVQGLAIKF